MPDRPLSHLANRLARRLPPRPAPHPPCLICWADVQDCRADYPRDGPVDVQAAVPGPYIVSRITTGYSGRDPGPAGGVLVATGRMDPPEADQP
jgi:hypothetical protein